MIQDTNRKGTAELLKKALETKTQKKFEFLQIMFQKVLFFTHKRRARSYFLSILIASKQHFTNIQHTMNYQLSSSWLLYSHENVAV